MAKSPKQDELKTIYGIEATDAQQKLHALKKSNKELAAVMETRRKEMIKLEVQGKKNSDAYKKLAAANRESNTIIKKNTAAIREQENEMGVSALTMNQLRARAKALRNELNNVSKAFEPERWEQTNRKLNETNNRMTELRQNATVLNKNMGQSFLSKGAFASFFGNVYAQVFLRLTAGVTKMKEFVKESIELAAKAQGIDHAFNRIANKDYLSSLRKQTKGLVSDFTLMKSAVRAENFDIPLTQLGTLLEFAQNRARDTGESVDYLVESIINGIGRKSPLILDNLGISAVKLQEEVKKTGDFASAVGKIIEEEMAAAGPAIDTAADAAQRKKVAWENLQLATGKYFLGFKTGWAEFTTRFAEGLAKLISGQESATKKMDDQVKKVAELESSVIPLVGRYEELKSKTKLTKDESAELTKTMNTIAATIPGVVTQFDRYGNALDINAQKVYAFIAAEKAKLAVMNREAIKETNKDIKKTEEKVDGLKNTIAKGGYDKSVGQSITGYTQSVFTPFSGEELDKLKLALAEQEGVLSDHREKLKFLDGTSVEEQIEIQKRGIDKRKEFNALSEKELASYITKFANQKDKYIEIAREVYNARFAASDDTPAPSAGKSTEDTNKEKFNTELSALDENNKKQLLLLKNKLLEEGKTEEWFKTESIKLQEEYFASKIALQNKYNQSTVDTEMEQADFRLNMQKTADEMLLKSLKASNDSMLNVLESKSLEEKQLLQEQVDSGLISRKQYTEAIALIDLNAAQDRLEAAKIYEQEVQNATFATVDAKNEALKQAADDVKKAQSDEQKAQEKANKAKLSAEQEYQAERKSIMDRFGLTTARDIYQRELDELNKAHAQGLLSTEEYERAKFQIRMKFYTDYAQKAVALTNYAADAISAIHTAQADNLEADKQRELTAAGDNAAERERIEREYAQKELNLKKKQANADAGIKIAQTVAAGALAGMQAFAQLGPIAGAVAAALIAVTTAAQIASILAERRKIMSTTLDSSTGGSSNTSRVVTGLQSGGYFDVEREQDGKKYKATFDPKRRGFINRPTVLVGDGPAGKSAEWVASNDALQNTTVAPFIQLLDDAQQAGNIRTIDLNHLMRARMAGFTSGGFIDQQPQHSFGKTKSSVIGADVNSTSVFQILSETKDLLVYLKTNGVRGEWNYHEFKKVDEKIEAIKLKARKK